jgi:TldD protein
MTKKFYDVHDIPRREFLKWSLKSGIAVAAAPSIISALGCNIIDTGPGSTVIDPEMLKATIAHALRQGGEFAEVYVENRISRQIAMEESKFRDAVFGISQGAGVRVISGDKTGYAYTDEITAEKLQHAAEVASYIARGAETTAPVSIDLKPEARPSFNTVRHPLEGVTEDRRLEVMQRANQAALDHDPRVKTAFISYYDEVRGRTIANSEGLLLEDELPLLFFIVQTLGIGDKTRHMGRERLSAHSGFELFEETSPETVALTAAEESIRMLDARDCPAGKMDVVMQNGWGGVLVHEAVGHPLEGDNIARETGAFTGKLGQKVASDVFTMIDDGTLPNHRGTTNFDDEGTPMQRNVLIRNGVLEMYMTDILSAKQLGLPRTGNGRRESFRYMPIPRMTNTFIDQGVDAPEDILASTKSGVFVKSLSGGSVNSTTGVFNFTCREAYLIENGKKTTPLKGATLIGDCMDIVSNIDAVGNDLAFGPGICGKGQSAEVNAGQPTVRIRQINVGGSRGRS